MLLQGSSYLKVKRELQHLYIHFVPVDKRTHDAVNIEKKINIWCFYYYDLILFIIILKARFLLFNFFYPAIFFSKIV